MEKKNLFVLDECVEFIETRNTIQEIQKQAAKDTSTQK
jgi:hypothetical protein